MKNISPNFRNWTIGTSVEQRAIECHVLTAPSVAIAEKVSVLPKPTILVLAGVHADEVEGVWVVEAALAEWHRHFRFGDALALAVVPCLNPDGYLRKTRQNAHGVDLNRNMPTLDFNPVAQNPRYQPGAFAASEPETQCLVQLIDTLSPIAILSAHSFSKVQVNANGPSRSWAAALAQVCGYPVTDDIGYPTPGSLGTYSGKERGIPTITLEIERGLTKDKVLQQHLPTLNAAVEYWIGKVPS